MHSAFIMYFGPQILLGQICGDWQPKHGQCSILIGVSNKLRLPYM